MTTNLPKDREVLNRADQWKLARTSASSASSHLWALLSFILMAFVDVTAKVTVKDDAGTQHPLGDDAVANAYLKLALRLSGHPDNRSRRSQLNSVAKVLKASVISALATQVQLPAEGWWFVIRMSYAEKAQRMVMTTLPTEWQAEVLNAAYGLQSSHSAALAGQMVKILMAAVSDAHLLVLSSKDAGNLLDKLGRPKGRNNTEDRRRRVLEAMIEEARLQAVLEEDNRRTEASQAAKARAKAGREAAKVAAKDGNVLPEASENAELSDEVALRDFVKRAKAIRNWAAAARRQMEGAEDGPGGELVTQLEKIGDIAEKFDTVDKARQAYAEHEALVAELAKVKA